MGCDIPQVTVLKVIHDQVEEYDYLFLYEDLEYELSQVSQEVFQKKLGNDAIIFGYVSCNQVGKATIWAKMIEDKIANNIYFKNDAFLEGFQNFSEILAREFNSTTKNSDTNCQVYKQHPHSYIPKQLKISLSCAMKVNEKLYFLSIQRTDKGINVVFKSPIVFYQLRNSTEIIQSRPSDFNQITDMVLEMREIAFADIACLILSDENCSLQMMVNDPRNKYPTYSFSNFDQMNQLRVFFSKDHFNQFDLQK